MHVPCPDTQNRADAMAVTARLFRSGAVVQTDVNTLTWPRTKAGT